MLATLIDAPFDDKDWIFETKWDGFRLVARTGGRNGTLYSRNGNDVTRRYASVAEALDVIKRNAVIDGELVALDAEGRSRFQLLQNALKGKARLRYYCSICSSSMAATCAVSHCLSARTVCTPSLDAIH